jgi:ABC-type amino acid transport substrate-binding protein
MLRGSSTAPKRQRLCIATSAIAVLALAPALFAQAGKKAPPPAPAASSTAGTLDRVKASGTLKLGFRSDARPLSFQGQDGKAAGYSVDLCQNVVEAVKSELSLPALKVDWVPVTVDSRLSAVKDGQVDLLCGATTATLERRKNVAFSSPIFPGGVAALIRSDAPKQLRNILAGKAQEYTPVWRAVALNILREQVFVTVAGTTAEQAVQRRAKELQVDSRMLPPVASYDEGVQAVVDRKANAFFAERAILIDAVRRNPSGKNLTIVDRQFTYEPLALALARGDEDFRLLVDRALSKLYASTEFWGTYKKWFGEPDEATITFYRWNTLAE